MLQVRMIHGEYTRYSCIHGFATTVQQWLLSYDPFQCSVPSFMLECPVNWTVQEGGL